MIANIICLFIGAFIGVTVMCLLTVSKEDPREHLGQAEIDEILRKKGLM